MREMLIQLEVDQGDRRWQERANCLGVDPDLFFPERGPPPRRPRPCAAAARSRPSASSTRSGTARSSASGAACRSGSAAGSAGSGRCGAAAAQSARPRSAVGSEPAPGPAEPRLDRRRRASSPLHARNARRSALELGRGDEPHELDRATAVPRALRASRTAVHAASIPVAREVDEVHRHLRTPRTLEPEARAHARRAGRRRARAPPRDRAGDREVVGRRARS